METFDMRPDRKKKKSFFSECHIIGESAMFIQRSYTYSTKYARRAATYSRALTSKQQEDICKLTQMRLVLRQFGRKSSRKIPGELVKKVGRRRVSVQGVVVRLSERAGDVKDGTRKRDMEGRGGGQV